MPPFIPAETTTFGFSGAATSEASDWKAGGSGCALRVAQKKRPSALRLRLRWRQAENWHLEIVGIIHARNVCLGVQEPEHLIVRLVVIRLVGVAWDAEVHWNCGIAQGSGSEQCLWHILVRLPENAL